MFSTGQTYFTRIMNPYQFAAEMFSPDHADKRYILFIVLDYFTGKGKFLEGCYYFLLLKFVKVEGFSCNYCFFFQKMQALNQFI